MKILFEDQKILAIDKPSGLPSQSLVHSPSSVESLLHQSRPPENTLLLHRLDTGTSGVLLFAKDQATFSAMREKFKRREIKKFYFAWSQETPERTKMLETLVFPLKIDLPLAHHPKSAKRMIPLSREKNADRALSYRGKPLPALTSVDGWEKVQWQGLSALKFNVQIFTGVMHQIRVHLKWLGFPLLGDPIYGDDASKAYAIDKRIPLGLHAARIIFELDGINYTICSHYNASHNFYSNPAPGTPT